MLLLWTTASDYYCAMFTIIAYLTIIARRALPGVIDFRLDRVRVCVPTIPSITISSVDVAWGFTIL